jgi:hypothetical protein
MEARVNFPVVPPDAGAVTSGELVAVVVVVVECAPRADRDGAPDPLAEASAVTAATTATMATTLTTQYRRRWTSNSINVPLVRA